MVGTSSDRIGTPDGQSFFVTVAKDLEPLSGLPIAPYVGVAWSTHEERALAIAGLGVRLGRSASALVIFDGVHLHPTLGWTGRRFGAQLLLVRGKHPGVSVNARF